MQKANFALICARGLGDALLSMVLARNLTLSGFRVTLFSTILCELQEWFPEVSIQPYPQFHSAFTPFDRVIAADHSPLPPGTQEDKRLMILKESEFDKTETMVHNLQAVCKNKLFLNYIGKENGITPLPSCRFHAYPKRVVIHPMSADEKKNWPAEKFIELARRLEKKGYHPYFCVSPQEAKTWRSLVASEQLPFFPTVSELASFVYESGFHIGNDSGVGHLASALGIPTLSLFARKSYAHLWRPGWAPGLVATPLSLLLGSRLKQKYWKELLTVSRVERAFDKLIDL